MNLSLKKKLFFFGILFCFVWFLIEFMSFGVYRLRYGSISFSGLQNERARIVIENGGASAQQNPEQSRERKNWNVLHPYVGFTTEGIDPNTKCPDQGVCDQRLRTYEDLPFVKSNEKNLIVAVIGGSFAHGISHGSSPGFLENELKKIPRFRDKEIVVYHLSAGGYKQPQQLLKINYFLSLGAEFDIIINVDGFNEIALPGVENLSKGVHPVFPRSWYYYVDASLNPDLLALYGRRTIYQQEQSRWASFFSTPLLYLSPTANLLWRFNNVRLNHKIKMADVALVEYHESSERKLQYVTTGPDYQFTSWPDFYQDMAAVWARSSLQLHNLCHSQGIEYYHFLQPNQYVEGSKPMLEEEAKTALSVNSKYGKAAKEGYPFLIDRGKWLQDKGVFFKDLTMMFLHTKRKLYIDDCCHLNMPGYSLVIQEIAKSLSEFDPSKGDSPE